MSPAQAWKSCRSKVRFEDEYAAQRRGKKLGLRVYDCHLCGGFHLSSSW